MPIPVAAGSTPSIWAVMVVAVMAIGPARRVKICWAGAGETGMCLLLAYVLHVVAAEYLFVRIAERISSKNVQQKYVTCITLLYI